jgi:hypothetical protein
MLAELYQLAQGQGHIAERAQFALQITEQFQAGAITESEYQELMRDLARFDDVCENSDELAARTLLFTAVVTIAKLS